MHFLLKREKKKQEASVVGDKGFLLAHNQTSCHHLSVRVYNKKPDTNSADMNCLAHVICMVSWLHQDGGLTILHKEVSLLLVSLKRDHITE